jgi:hypothetical protein
MSDEVDQETETENLRSRRRILQLAGAAGAAGAAALVAGAGAGPAGAANGDSWILGGSLSTNVATSPTELSGISDSLGTLLVQASDTSGSAPAIVAEGSSAGDIKCNGTGRLSQIAASGVTGDLAPTFSPNSNLSSVLHELVRSDTGVLWATVGTSGGADWKRINAVRVDEASGNGDPFPPARILNTRTGSGTPIAANGTLNVQVTGEGGVPSGAIAVFGNLTAVAPNNSSFADSGFLTLFPQGVTRPTVSNVNPAAGGLAFPNFFFVGLSSSGQLSVFANIESHAIIDIFAYVQ